MTGEHDPVMPRLLDTQHNQRRFEKIAAVVI